MNAPSSGRSSWRLPMGFSSKRPLFIVCRTAFGAAFVWAAWTKILDPDAFARAIANYDLLPHSLVGFTAAVLPWVELVCGGLLVAGLWTDGSVLVLNALLVVFTAALAASMIRGLNVACGCFSLDAEASGSQWGYLLRDATMLAVGLWLLVHPLRKRNERSETIL